MKHYQKLHNNVLNVNIVKLIGGCNKLELVTKLQLDSLNVANVATYGESTNNFSRLYLKVTRNNNFTMPTKRRKKDPTWDEIGEAIGKKMEKGFKSCDRKKKPWMFYQQRDGGGFGRFIFIIGLLYAMHLMGMLVMVPLWVLIIIVIGFSLMKF